MATNWLRQQLINSPVMVVSYAMGIAGALRGDSLDRIAPRNALTRRIGPPSQLCAAFVVPITVLPWRRSRGAVKAEEPPKSYPGEFCSLCSRTTLQG